MFCLAEVPNEHFDYIALLYPAIVDITRTKGPDTHLGPIITIVEWNRRDKLTMDKMYGLEMVVHDTGGQPSTDLEIGDVNRQYPLNNHVKALLRIGTMFWDPIENYIPIYEGTYARALIWTLIL